MTSYEGLVLETGRASEGRLLLQRAAASLSEGMLANTTNSGVAEFNTADATLWFLHAVDRHVAVTGDLDLAASLLGALAEVIEHHVAGTRHGIRVDPADGRLTRGRPGLALTWMDARIGGVPVTPRAGKAVEINALWVNGLAAIAGLQERLGRDSGRIRALEAAARSSFSRRFQAGGQLLDVADGPGGHSTEMRPNQLLAISLPHAPLADPAVARACAAALRTSLGLRSLSPAEPAYQGRHRGGIAERDRAYHQSTVWPWLIGPYVQATTRTGGNAGGTVASTLAGLEAHLREWGPGSVSETAEGDPPHAATGCPFQAWSVAELLQARRLARSNTPGSASRPACIPGPRAG